jgi:hypothetical protein
VAAVLRDPTFRALASAAVLIGLWFGYGPVPHWQPVRTQLLRHEWKQCADVVLLGDSSTLWTLRPELIEDELGGGYRVVNFAFTGILFSDQHYLSVAEGVLDTSRPHSTVVLAVNSSNSRRAAAAGPSTFAWEAGVLKQQLAEGHRPTAVVEWDEQLALRLQPRGLCAFLWNLCPWGDELTIGYNGAQPMTQVPADETRLVPMIIEANRRRPLYDLTELQPLVQWIAKLRAKDVQVIAYVERDRPAIAPLNVAAGFDPARIAQLLRDAGANVIEYPADLTTVDGVHLDVTSARRWSRALGKVLAEVLPSRPAAPGGRCPWPNQSDERR